MARELGTYCFHGDDAAAETAAATANPNVNHMITVCILTEAKTAFLKLHEIETVFNFFRIGLDNPRYSMRRPKITVAGRLQRCANPAAAGLDPACPQRALLAASEKEGGKKE